jgi:hypothetical protein
MKMNKNIIRIPIKRGSRRDANLGQTNVGIFKFILIQREKEDYKI